MTRAKAKTCSADSLVSMLRYVHKIVINELQRCSVLRAFRPPHGPKKSSLWRLPALGKCRLGTIDAISVLRALGACSSGCVMPVAYKYKACLRQPSAVEAIDDERRNYLEPLVQSDFGESLHSTRVSCHVSNFPLHSAALLYWSSSRASLRSSLCRLQLE